MRGKFLSHVFFNVKEKLTARHKANLPGRYYLLEGSFRQSWF